MTETEFLNWVRGPGMQIALVDGARRLTRRPAAYRAVSPAPRGPAPRASAGHPSALAASAAG